MGAYFMRDFPPELLAALKHQAIEQGISLRKLVIFILRQYVGQPQDEKKGD